MKYGLILENWRKFASKTSLNEQEEEKKVKLFILIGPPAVGKSTWEKKYFAGIPEDQILKINRDDIIEKRFLSTGFSNKILFSTPPDSVPTGEIDPDKSEFGKVIQYEFGGKVRRAYENIFKATDKINSVYYKRLKEAHSGYYPYVVFDGLYSTPEERKKVTDSFSHLKNLKKIAVFFEFQDNKEDIYDRSVKRAQSMEKQFGSVKGRKFDRRIGKSDYDKIFAKIIPPTKEEPANFDVIMNVKYGSDGEYETINEQIFEIDDLELIQILEEAKKKRAYKPNFSREKKQGLHGWFARNKGKGWINCRTGGPCGRSSADKKGGKYPACRPTKAQCKSAGKGPLRKKKSSKPISWTKKKKKED
jgi:hypothetical protein